ncbi:hypothetical protein LEMLEM_LOCUS8602, partial [Lemmus lemmus]
GGTRRVTSEVQLGGVHSQLRGSQPWNNRYHSHCWGSDWYTCMIVCLSICLCTVRIPDACGGQKRLSDPWNCSYRW